MLSGLLFSLFSRSHISTFFPKSLYFILLNGTSSACIGRLSPVTILVRHSVPSLPAVWLRAFTSFSLLHVSHRFVTHARPALRPSNETTELRPHCFPSRLRLESEQGFLSFDTVHGCDFLSLECEPISQTFSSLHPATIAATAIAMAAVTTGQWQVGPVGAFRPSWMPVAQYGTSSWRE